MGTYPGVLNDNMVMDAPYLRNTVYCVSYEDNRVMERCFVHYGTPWGMHDRHWGTITVSATDTCARNGTPSPHLTRADELTPRLVVWSRN